MIFFQTLWFMIKTAILIAAGVWLALRPGFINISFLDYDVRMQTGAGLTDAAVVIRRNDVASKPCSIKSSSAASRMRDLVSAGSGALSAGFSADRASLCTILDAI